MKRSVTDIILMLMNVAWRRRYLIAVPILLMIPISILAARFAPKNYVAKTIILLNETGKDNPFLKDYAIGLQLKQRMRGLEALLRSEHVLLKVISDLRSSDTIVPNGDIEREMRKLSQSISVRLVGRDLLELTLKGNQAKGMGRVLELILQHFMERLLSPEQSTLGATQKFLELQLTERRKKLEKAELALAEFTTKNASLVANATTTDIRSLGKMSQQLQDKRMESAAAAAAFENIKSQLIRSNPIVGKLEENIVRLTGELTALQARYTNDHSLVQAAKRKLARLETERSAYLRTAGTLDKIAVDHLWSIASGKEVSDGKTPPLLVSQLLQLQTAQARHASLNNDVSHLETALDRLQQDLSRTAPLLHTYERLQKNVQVAREAYQLFAKRFDSARTSRALGLFEAPERVKIIDPPRDPTIPTTPPKMIYIVAGIIAGIGLGTGLAFVFEMFDPRIRTPADFVEVTGLPVITKLPNVKAAR